MSKSIFNMNEIEILPAEKKNHTWACESESASNQALARVVLEGSSVGRTTGAGIPVIFSMWLKALAKLQNEVGDCIIEIEFDFNTVMWTAVPIYGTSKHE